jgi:hypothetical protein
MSIHPENLVPWVIMRLGSFWALGRFELGLFWACVILSLGCFELGSFWAWVVLCPGCLLWGSLTFGSFWAWVVLCLGRFVMGILTQMLWQGTSCGAGYWCRRGSCVPQREDDPPADSYSRQVAGGQPLHGGWSQWSRLAAILHCKPFKTHSTHKL